MHATIHGGFGFRRLGRDQELRYLDLVVASRFCSVSRILAVSSANDWSIEILWEVPERMTGEKLDFDAAPSGAAG